MSNLGFYQAMTTAAKKIGGPIPFLLATAFAGYGIGKGVELGVKKIGKIWKKHDNSEIKWIGKILDIIADGKERGELELHISDKIKILAIDKNVVLIEKIGDSNSPYFVSSSFITALTGIDIV